MLRSSCRAPRRAALLALTLVATAGTSGCAVVAVTGTAVGIAASGVGLAADAAIGTVRLTGKAVGAAADLALPDKPAE